MPRIWTDCHYRGPRPHLRHLQTLRRHVRNSLVGVYWRSVPLHTTRSSTVQKSVLLAAIQKEIHRHDLYYFVDKPPSFAQGGKGVVVSGYPACKKRINTISQFLDHLTKDAMPALIEGLCSSITQGLSLVASSCFSQFRADSAFFATELTFCALDHDYGHGKTDLRRAVAAKSRPKIQVEIQACK